MEKHYTEIKTCIKERKWYKEVVRGGFSWKDKYNMIGEKRDIEIYQKNSYMGYFAYSFCFYPEDKYLQLK